MKKLQLAAYGALIASMASLNAGAQSMKMNDLEYFEKTGSNVLVYNNIYNGGFCDEKLAGIELIQKGERIGTGGGIRLMNTPEQWDIYGTMTNREVNRAQNYVEVELTYEDYNFVSKIRVTPKDAGVLMQVFLDKPVPQNLVGKAGMNLEFFPASYFGKNYLVDGAARILPKYPQHNTEVRPVSEKIPQYFGETTFDDRGRGEFLVPIALSTGHQIVLAPEDSGLTVGITSDQEVSIYDGRLLAQNGTFVVRSLLPAGKTGKVLEWYVEPADNPDWIRKPNIGFSQVGYTPAQKKVAVVELDKRAAVAKTAKILRVTPTGKKEVALEAAVENWGVYNNRYNYARIDFSSITTPGLYSILYDGVESNAFPIDKDIYSDKWHASMDIALVVNMDHMMVNEAYRVWHGAANMDDGLMAPANISLHDGYRQGDENWTKYKPLEHVPGLAVGGWYDAGDFDIQQNSVVTTTSDLAKLWRMFQPERDMTFIDQATKYADIHRPDGIPDAVQQIMHGTLNMNAQIEALGFVSGNIGQPQMHQYHHLGDAVNLTDGLIYDPSLAPYEVSADGKRSGTYDDRIIMTRKPSAAGVMNSIVALAAAYPALKAYFPEEAERSIKNAEMLWDKYVVNAKPEDEDPMMARWGGGANVGVNGAIELYFATGKKEYKDYFMSRIKDEIQPSAPANNRNSSGAFMPRFNLNNILRIYDLLDKKQKAQVDKLIPGYVESLAKAGNDNPYEVTIAGSGWGGNNQVIGNAFNLYQIWKKYPDLVDPNDILKGLNYLYGCHPYSNVSFILGVGVNTKKVAYGNTRADYTTIAGGVAPGLLVRNPDFLENKDDYPFLWGENECCINSVPNYVMLTLAAQEVAEAINK
ncbi:MAG: glycoside hydrolase family 9 protein [Bacteroidales bacterium]|nr:glycoside hydrolase family 9 protein [Bacteroidales bacterium]